MQRKEHQWIDVGFIRPRLVCKECDLEKEEAPANPYCLNTTKTWEDVDWTIAL